MSAKLPALDGAIFVRALERAGFLIDRVTGSHYVMRYPDGRKTSVLVHAGKTLRRGLLAALLKDTRISAEALRKFL